MLGTPFEQAGGEAQVRKIVSRFVDRMFDDLLIGFLFVRASRERVKAKEYELAASHLGAGVRYTGRPLAEVHAPHRINIAMYHRRLKLLEETLQEMNTPAQVRAHWLHMTERMRDQILPKSGGDACAPPAAPSGAREEPAGREPPAAEAPGTSGGPGDAGGKGT